MRENSPATAGLSAAADRVVANPASPPDGWPIPRAAYVHIPFCRHRCGYCNFSVVAGRDELADRFLNAIDRELAMLDRPAIQTLFVGGGTPTHLSPRQLERLLALLRQRFATSDSLEWSVEANPEDLSNEKLTLLRDAGVNRLSIGVQSFNDAKLRKLERGHRGTEAIDAVREAARFFDNISLDLIFAAPGENLATWRADVDTALTLPITHLSTYGLTFEKGTSFWSRRRDGEIVAASESGEVEMYQLTRQLVADHGWQHYEISNFSQPGFRCRHNLAYWHGRGWYAAGPGAARFVDGRREVNHRSPTTYLRRVEAGVDPTAESDTLSLEQYARERAAFGIRLSDGIDVDQLSKECGFDLRNACEAAVMRRIEQGLLEQSGKRVRLTERGRLFADSVASDLLG